MHNLEKPLKSGYLARGQFISCFFYFFGSGRKWKSKFRKSVRAVVFNKTCVSIIYIHASPLYNKSVENYLKSLELDFPLVFNTFFWRWLLRLNLARSLFKCEQNWRLYHSITHPSTSNKVFAQLTQTKPLSWHFSLYYIAMTQLTMWSPQTEFSLNKMTFSIFVWHWHMYRYFDIWTSNYILKLIFKF